MPAKNASGIYPYNTMVAITTSDTVNIATGVTDAVIVTVAGNAVIIDASGNSTAHTSLPVGTLIPVRVVRVNATGSTATLAALYY